MIKKVPIGTTSMHDNSLFEVFIIEYVLFLAPNKSIKHNNMIMINQG
jgi:hypothetical protein